MILLLMLLYVLPVIVWMIVNGVRGKGYKLAFTLPSRGSKHWLLARTGVAAYSAIGLILVVLSQIDSYRANNMSPREILHSALFFISSMGVVVLIMLHRNKKTKS